MLTASAAAVHPVRVFLSPDSAVGFGLCDWIEFGAAVLLWLFFVRASARRSTGPARTGQTWTGQIWTRNLAAKTVWCTAFLVALPVVLRLALLGNSPEPTPSGSDDFGYILLADTLRHFRFANPPHPLSQFFEQIFVLQQPTYSSMYPLGQGLALAFGWLVFGHPWAGVLLSVGAFCSACYWMLRAWTTPVWALAGGLLAIFEFGPLSYWTNSYWGGAVSATAGCLVFGALPRLGQGNQHRRGYAAVLGIGLAAQLLTRPFEFILLLLSAALFFLPAVRGKKWRQFGVPCGIVFLILCGAGLLMCFQNKKVTGSWTTLPYVLYRYQYGVPATFTLQAKPVPHRQLNPEQELDYRAESAIHGDGPETFGAYLDRLLFRARFYRFFFFAPLYLALAAFVIGIREFRFIWVVLTILIFSLGANFYPYFYPHYIAAITCLFVLASVTGLRSLNRWTFGRARGVAAGSLVLFLCTAQFLFWYGIHAFGSEHALSSLGRYETWDFINWGDPQGRIRINNELAKSPGKALVFVRYGPRHMFQEWVHNAAGIDGSRMVWAHDLGPAEDEKLRKYYPDRKAWLLEPDAIPPKLRPYPSTTASFEQVP